MPDETNTVTPSPEDGAFAEEDAQDQDISSVGLVSKKDKAHLDFATSIVLFVFCAVMAVNALGYYRVSKKVFYASAGFMPILIAAMLFLASFALMLQSLKGSSVSERARQIAESVPDCLKSRRFWNSVAALAMFGVYIYVLLKFLPFWLSSLLLLFFVFVYLNAASIFKSALISALSVGGIVLLFQVIFRVPMP